ncbi:hypothetical protein PIB30_008213 [Stylosanthes scabra]|uniref:Uncharacterized protein n=1 Tax=Stylosanthes scabra TaxID=79078 RepID=A0ABU6Q5S3_9FABA|nr:hypothetical protein [Stylosanthes scabra]
MRPINEYKRAKLPNFISFFLNSSKKRRKKREMRIGGGGGDHYSPATSDDHNSHTRAPIDAPFAATRSSRHPLRFYHNIEESSSLSKSKNHHPLRGLKVNAIITLIPYIFMNPCDEEVFDDIFNAKKDAPINTFSHNC